MIACRGVRGATTVEENTRDAILAASSELLKELVTRNDLHPDDITSVIFSTTADLNAEFPAIAARQRGWADVALLCTHEMQVPDSLPMCVRILIHWNTEKSAQEIEHVYIKGAVNLRPDIATIT